jgi:aspartyl-tRNA(Asn)/glutamyl-tRNA(Gln) amidotransferase subunit C
MSFTQDDVNKLAHLARIALNETSNEEHSFEHSIAEDLNKILRLVSEISEINTDNIEPMQHSQSYAQRMRPDAVTEPDVRTEMQRLVPENAVAAGLYLVPVVKE